MRRTYRAWINQPRTQQALHRLHGRYCIVEDTGDTSVRVWFTEGSVHSMMVPRDSVIECKLSLAQD
jgi:hypothetical protein